MLKSRKHFSVYYHFSCVMCLTTLVYVSLFFRSAQDVKDLYFLEMNSMVLCSATPSLSKTAWLEVSSAGTASSLSWWTGFTSSTPGLSCWEKSEASLMSFRAKHLRYLSAQSPFDSTLVKYYDSWFTAESKSWSSSLQPGWSLRLAQGTRGQCISGGVGEKEQGASLILNHS